MEEVMFRFHDRSQAGALLAQALHAYAHNKHAIVIGLPRGGVVVAYEIAKKLHLPLDIIVPRKIGAPMQPELAVGAVTEDGSVLYNQDVMQQLGLRPADLAATIEAEVQEARRRINVFRAHKPPLDLHGETVIMVDDGVATGATMRAALESARHKGAQYIILALPVAPPEFRGTVASAVDEVVILQEPEFFPSVGYFYERFDQTEDQEVIKLLGSLSGERDKQ